MIKKTFVGMLISIAAVGISVPAAHAASVDCFHKSVKDPAACVAKAIEQKLPEPQGVVVFRDKDCNYLVVQTGSRTSGTYSLVHKLDGVRPQIGARLYGVLGFDSLFKSEGKVRTMQLNEVGDKMRLRNVQSDLDASTAAKLFVDRCKSSK